jgi:glucose-1-phosphate thymidylyltransferase
LNIACLEEIAYTMGYITLDQLMEQGNRLKNSQYGQYILEICRREQGKR